jgi:hypothetical protein
VIEIESTRYTFLTLFRIRDILIQMTDTDRLRTRIRIMLFFPVDIKMKEKFKDERKKSFFAYFLL